MISLHWLKLAGEYGDRAIKSLGWKCHAVAADEARWAAHLALMGCSYLADDQVQRSGLTLCRSKVDPGELPG